MYFFVKKLKNSLQIDISTTLTLTLVQLLVCFQILTTQVLHFVSPYGDQGLHSDVHLCVICITPPLHISDQMFLWTTHSVRSTVTEMLRSRLSVVSLPKETDLRTSFHSPSLYRLSQGSIIRRFRCTSKCLWSSVQLILSYLQFQRKFKPLLAVEWFTHLYYIFHSIFF